MLLSYYTFKVVFPQYHCNQLYERDSYFVNLIVSRIVCGTERYTGAESIRRKTASGANAKRKYSRKIGLGCQKK